MFLSRVTLDLQKRETLNLLSSPSRIHGIIEASLSSSERKRNLWRVDQIGDERVLLILSEEVPNLKDLDKSFGLRKSFETSYKVRDYDILLNRLELGQNWRFRLTANPVKSISPGSNTIGKRGKVVAHVTTEQQKNWLLDKSKDLGFELKSDDFEVVSTSWKKFKKSGQHLITLKQASFEGTLVITDPDKFKLTLTHGIGREKAYGCGLLTIVQHHG